MSLYAGMRALHRPSLCSDSIINRSAFTGSAGLCDALHSPNIGSVVMATPTRVGGQSISAWRVVRVFLFFHY